MKKTARLPSSEPAKRITAIFHRKLTTKWSEKEIKTFRALVKDGYFDVLDSLGQIERCYRMQWPPRRDKNILRHDLATFLNHFQTELDRATAWCEAHPEKPKSRVIIPLPPVPSEPLILSDEDQERSDKFWAEYRARKKNGFCPENEEAGSPLLNPNAFTEPRSAFQKAWKEMGK